MIKKIFTGLVAFAATTGYSVLALAQEHVAGNTTDTVTPYGWALPIAIALGIGVVGLGGTLSQAKTASAALEGIARNPQAADKVFVPMILGLAFIESLVLFTWVLMLLMQLTMASGAA